MGNSGNANNKIAKAGAGYILGNYLLKGITFLSAPIFTRLLTTDEFGTLGAYLSYESMLYIIIGLALHSCIANAKYDYAEKYDDFVSSVITLVIGNTFVWILVANIFYGIIGDVIHMSRPIANILILHCFGTAMLQFFNSYVGLNYSVKEFLKLTYVNALGNMGLSILLILTVFNNSRLNGRILGIALPIIFIAIYIVIYFFKKSAPKINFAYWKYAIKFSAPIIPHGISQVILSSFDRIMIRDIIGPSEAGLYSFSYTIFSLVAVVSTSLDKVWKPWFYEKMNEKDYKSIGKVGTQYAWGLALFTVLVSLLSPEIVKILGSRDYWDTTWCVIPVILGGFFSFLYTMPVLVEYFYSKTRYIAIGSVAAAVINIALNYYFIPRNGYIAAAYTTLATYIIYFLFHFILAARIHGSSIFDVKSFVIISLVTVILGFGALGIQHYIVLRWLISLAVICYSAVWADKNFGIVKIVKKKLGK